MKKRNILLVSLISTFALSSCTQFISKNYDNKEKLLESIDKINSYDYTKDFTSILIYAQSKYKSEYDFGDYDSLGNHKDFAIINETEVFKLDFSNRDDLYIYDYTVREYLFVTGYNNMTGKANYSPISGVVTGYQFYKNNDKYIYNEYVNTKIKEIKSLDLDKSYIDESKKDELKALEGKFSSGLTNDEGKLLFDYYLMPEIEHNFRINEDILDNYVNDKSDIYEFSGNDKEFVIHGDSGVDIN